MKLTKTRRHKFRTGEYEHLELEATVEVDSEELDADADIALVVNQVLDDAMADDIDRADQSSKTPEEETYLHAWKDSI